MSFPEPFGNNHGAYPSQPSYGAPAYGAPAYGAPAYGASSPYGAAQQQGGYGGYPTPGQQDYRAEGSQASSFYGQQGAAGPQLASQEHDGQERQLDEHGNPIEPGERGLGTMAGGAVAGFAANKMTGEHHGKFKSAIGGAILAQGAKMLYDRFQDHRASQNDSRGLPPTAEGPYDGGYAGGQSVGVSKYGPSQGY